MDELNFSSHNQPDAEVERLWLEEAERRLAAYRDGSMKTVSLEEVMASCGQRLKNVEGLNNTPNKTPIF